MTFIPLVRGKTSALSPNVSSLMDELDAGSYYIPDYQRDSEQWDLPKRSLFIESLLNNLTIPPLILYPEDDPSGVERHQIIDGQQRLTTIRDFVRGGFSLAAEDAVEYAENVGPSIQGKMYAELPADMRAQIKRYVVNLIVLPKNLELGLRLEIFRRINEGGVPLSPQDLRLATFGQSDRVYFIRLAGIFDPTREGSARMISAGKQHNLTYPWNNHSYWESWWKDTALSSGQSASQAFLYYVVARDLSGIDGILASGKLQQTLNIKYDKTTTSVLDLYLAQLDYEHKQKSNAPQLAVNLDVLKSWFTDFETWFNTIKGNMVPRVHPNSSTKLAFFIAAAAQEWKSPGDLSEVQWEQVQLFLTKGPTEIKAALGMEFSGTRGKWPGQKKQIEQTFGICKKIANI